MAAETPFGLSFGNYGDPRKYIGQGQSPGKKIQQKIAKIQDSPLASLLGIGLASGGGQPAPASAPALGQGISAPSAPSIGVNIPGAVAPSSAPMPQAAPSVMPTQDLDGDGQVDEFWGVKSSSPQSSLQNPTDFNPLAPDTSNQVAVSPDDYRNIPGFGKLQKIAGQIMGMG
jgi:hypothetical protein